MPADGSIPPPDRAPTSASGCVPPPAACAPESVPPRYPVGTIHAHEPESSSAPAPEHTAALCLLCGRARWFRRRLCRSCYRKLSECGLTMPSARRPGPSARTPAERLAAWVESLPAEARRRLQVALQGAGEPEIAASLEPAP